MRRARRGVQAAELHKARLPVRLAQIRCVARLDVGPVAAHRQHVDTLARSRLRGFLRFIVHRSAQGSVPKQRGPLRNPLRGRLPALAQRADLRLEHIARHVAQRDLHIVRLREIDDPRLRARNHRADHLRARVRLREDHHGQIVVIRLRDARAALAS